MGKMSITKSHYIINIIQRFINMGEIGKRGCDPVSIFRIWRNSVPLRPSRGNGLSVRGQVILSSFVRIETFQYDW